LADNGIVHILDGILPLGAPVPVSSTSDTHTSPSAAPTSTATSSATTSATTTTTTTTTTTVGLLQDFTNLLNTSVWTLSVPVSGSGEALLDGQAGFRLPVPSVGAQFTLVFEVTAAEEGYLFSKTDGARQAYALFLGAAEARFDFTPVASSVQRASLNANMVDGVRRRIALVVDGSAVALYVGNGSQPVAQVSLSGAVEDCDATAAGCFLSVGERVNSNLQSQLAMTGTVHVARLYPRAALGSISVAAVFDELRRLGPTDSPEPTIGPGSSFVAFNLLLEGRPVLEPASGNGAVVNSAEATFRGDGGFRLQTHPPTVAGLFSFNFSLTQTSGNVGCKRGLSVSWRGLIADC
jgi:hypothetical protein